MENIAGEAIERCAQSGTRCAIVEPSGASIAYDGLIRRIRGMAEELAARGVRPDQRILLQVPNGIDFAITVLSSLLVGAVPVLCEPLSNRKVYLNQIKSAGVSWVLLDPMLKAIQHIPGAAWLMRKREIIIPPLPEKANSLEYIVLSRSVRRRIDRSEAKSHCDYLVARKPEDPGVIVFTGGTTSRPKGVVLSHRALRAYLESISSLIEDCPFDTFCADTPQQVLYGLWHGKTVFSTRGQTRKRARQVIELLGEGHVQAYFGSPYVWMELARQRSPKSPRMPETIRAVLLGGAPVTTRFLDDLGELLHPNTKVLVIYGMTEAGPVCAIEGKAKQSFRGSGDLVGAPMPSIQLSVLHKNDQGVGEIMVSGPSVCSGYLKEDTLLEGSSIATGDLGYLLPYEGKEMLVLLGRSKDMIIRQGINIYPGVVEPLLLSLRSSATTPLFEAVALIGLWNPVLQDEQIICCYQLHQNSIELSLTRIHTIVEQEVGQIYAPDLYFPLAEMPVTGRLNKIDKQALREKAARHFSLSLQAY